jgi:RNA polymerase sigma factor (sigma-70 family)
MDNILFNHIKKLDGIQDLTREECVEMRERDESNLIMRCSTIVPVLITRVTKNTVDLVHPMFPDLLSDGCMAVTKAVRSWNPEGGYKLSTWVYRITHGAVVDMLRKEQNHSDHIFTHNFSYGDPSFDEASQGERTEGYFLDMDDRAYGEEEGAGQRELEWKMEFELALRKLDEDEKDILIMLKNGHSQSEIARVMGVTQQAVSQRVVKIQQKLTCEDETSNGV